MDPVEHCFRSKYEARKELEGLKEKLKAWSGDEDELGLATTIEESKGGGKEEKDSCESGRKDMLLYLECRLGENLISTEETGLGEEKLVAAVEALSNRTAKVVTAFCFFNLLCPVFCCSYLCSQSVSNRLG